MSPVFLDVWSPPVLDHRHDTLTIHVSLGPVTNADVRTQSIDPKLLSPTYIALQVLVDVQGAFNSDFIVSNAMEDQDEGSSCFFTVSADSSGVLSFDGSKKSLATESSRSLPATRECPSCWEVQVV
jgi:hypothetical protein